MSTSATPTPSAAPEAVVGGLGRRCNTPGCGRATPSTEHGYCRDCIGTVIRTGRPPELTGFVPVWLRNMKAKDLTNAA